MQKIIIENFRQISFAEVEIKNLLFLIGAQASGKSTIAKLIYFFKSLKNDYFSLVYNEAKLNQTQLRTAFTNKIQEKFKIYFGLTADLQDNFCLTFYFNDNRYLKLSKRNTTLNVALQSDYLEQIIQTTNNLSQQIQEFSTRQIGTSQQNYLILEKTKSLFINQLAKQVNQLFDDDYEPMFFPSGRNITVSYPEQFQAMFLGNLQTPNQNSAKSIDLVLMKNFILHSKFLYDYFNGNSFETKTDISQNLPLFRFFSHHANTILQGKYQNLNGYEQLVYAESSNIALHLASSGQQESVRIIQDLYYILFEKRLSFRIIEEPEAHLYPQAQKCLIELIALALNTTASQFVITSHSPYILSVLNNLLMYSKVIKQKPQHAAQIENHFETTSLQKIQNQHINLLHSQVSAYRLDRNDTNYCVSLIDEETGLIGDNFLDNITEQLNNDFQTLYHLYFS